MPKRVRCFVFLLVFLFLGASFSAQEADPSDPLAAEGWPRDFPAADGTFTVYQPQVDQWDGHWLEAHAAVALKTPASEQPMFGVLWMTARTQVDKAQRIATMDQLEIPRARFPSAPADQAKYLKLFREDVAPKTKLIALDRLEAALAVLEAEKQARSVPVQNVPPKFLFSTTPAILVCVDGAPVYRPVPETKLERVINTRPLVLKDESGKHYLHVFDGWLESPALAGSFAVAKKPPKDLEKAKKASTDADLLVGGDPEDPKSLPSLKKGPVPRIYVATEPAELLVTEGEPKYAPIEGTELLYAKNTTGNLFKHIGDQKTYVLAAGRWFRAVSAAGPWELVAGTSLPPDFAKIPDDNAKENVKASVPGTAQAHEALIANQIPQTADVNVSEAKFEAKVDGEPKLALIEGTSLQYVVNSQVPIIIVDAQSFYAAENGVWFVATSVRGPWVIATAVPASIYSIPVSSPLHNVTYVKVYHATPTVVTVGYTPGYYGTCVSSGAVVYGTGYYYSPWVGTVWYGPPVTYGFGTSMTYTPWTGWTYGYSTANSVRGRREISA